MRRALITAAVVLAGCTTTNDVRSTEPILDARSVKSVAELSQCFGQNYQGKVYRIQQGPTDHGYSLTMRFNFNGMEATIGTADITDEGGARRLVVRARRADREGVKTIAERCV
jgi:hypothetical protein